MASFFTTAFYHFVALNDVKSMQPIIQDYCDKKLLKGTILLANEGINGTISGKEKDILVLGSKITFLILLFNLQIFAALLICDCTILKAFTIYIY